ncbi:MAG: hypothetical protein ABSD98_10660 [Candidatus Korobacteraceae bacterium]|jgi:hypothetical protein
MADDYTPYRQQIRWALAQLHEWDEKKKEAERQMTKLRSLILANANMLSDSERAGFVEAVESYGTGITDSIREIYRQAYPNGLLPTQVRDQLIATGFDLNSQANPMASIHSVIKRLIASTEIEPFGDAAFGGYRWKSKGLAPRKEGFTYDKSPKPPTKK